MPEVIVRASEGREGEPVTLRERVSETSLDSEHYAAQLIERIGWAVVDASEREQDGRPTAAAPERG